MLVQETTPSYTRELTPPIAQVPKKVVGGAKLIFSGVGILLVAALFVVTLLTPGDHSSVGRYDGGGVPWDDDDPSVCARFDAMARDGGCSGLQDEFDTAAANNDATTNRIGRNNADLMRYIDDKLDEAGCCDDEG